MNAIWKNLRWVCLSYEYISFFWNSCSEPAEEICLGMDKTIAGLEKLKTKGEKNAAANTMYQGEGDMQYSVGKVKRSTFWGLVVVVRGGRWGRFKKANGCQDAFDLVSSTPRWKNTHVHSYQEIV